MAYTNVLELGTSLGICSLYLASPSKNINLHTIEGDPGSHDVARHIFQEVQMENIHSSLGLFRDLLPGVLSEMKRIDLAFIDGHHDKDATLEYFEQILPYCTEKSAVIFDDIYWSKGMTEAWESIKAMPKVKLSIDLFFCGIVFFREENREKEAFKIRPGKILFHR